MPVLCVVRVLYSEDASCGGDSLSLNDIDDMLKGLSAELEQMLSNHSASAVTTAAAESDADGTIRRNDMQSERK